MPFWGPILIAAAQYIANRRNSRRTTNTGQEQSSYGRGLIDAGLRGLGNLDEEYVKLLREGGLPEDVRKGYRVQQGRLTDESTRATKAFAAELTQRAKVSGGRVDPQAAIDAQIDYDANTNDALFNARNALAFDEANRSLENTNAILDALARIRGMRVSAGSSILGGGNAMWMAGVNQSSANNTALLDAIARIYSSYYGRTGNA